MWKSMPLFDSEQKGNSTCTEKPFILDSNGFELGYYVTNHLNLPEIGTKEIKENGIGMYSPHVEIPIFATFYVTWPNCNCTLW